jgi:hypothetical protein
MHHLGFDPGIESPHRTVFKIGRTEERTPPKGPWFTDLRWERGAAAINDESTVLLQHPRLEAAPTR